MKPHVLVLVLVLDSSRAAILTTGQLLWMGTYYDEVIILSVDQPKKTAQCRMRVATKFDEYQIKVLPLDKVPKPALEEYQSSPRFAGARFISTIPAELKAALADTKTPAGLEKIKASVKSVREVETDLKSFQGKLIWLSGQLEVSAYYTDGYSDAKDTHYAFKLRDKNRSAYLYADRNQGETLRRVILDHPNAPMLCLVAMVPGRANPDDTDIMAELLQALPQ